MPGKKQKRPFPFLPEICLSKRVSCPVTQTSPRKPRRKSPVFATRKLPVSELFCKSKSPRSRKTMQSDFAYAETLLVPRPPTMTCLGFSASLKAIRKSSIKNGHGSGKSKSKDGQTERRTPQEKHEDTSQKINSSISSLLKICQPRQRRQSRDQLGSSFHTSAESRAKAPQGPRRFHPPNKDRLHLCRCQVENTQCWIHMPCLPIP